MIRVATTDDSARLAEIHAASFADVWDAAALAALMAGEGALGLCAPDGFILIRTVADEAEILTVAVAPAGRRKGLARALVTHAAAAARTAGAARLFLEVSATNTAALALYEGLGFSEIGRRRAYYADGADARVMGLTLS